MPLLVGGTMLYFKALQEGLSDLPAADPAIRLVIDTHGARRAGRRCTKSSRASTRRRPSASTRTTRSAFSARWR